ncbi:MAG: DUF1844 domain-containing protein [Anaerohalosphaera sp.]|nr:DUF1844 domain-containing protein [Anaerohalosphaera sp.]
MTEENTEKKIIVDEDWKAQAQKEKEELASEEISPEQPAEQGPALPPADIKSLVSMHATQGFFAMGLLVMDKDSEPKIDLPMAKFNIDMLGVIEEKTKGNLTDEEKEMLESTLQQIRMAFVQVSQSQPQ